MNAKYFILTLSLLLSALLIQACTDSTVSNERDTLITSSTDILPAFSQKTDGPNPQKVYNDFVAMVEKVHQMNREEIEAMSDAQILELGKPILDATEGTTTLAKTTLAKINLVLQPLAQNLRDVSRKEHKAVSFKINQIISTDVTRRARSLESRQVRQILLKMNEGAESRSSSCEDLYDQWGGYVHLYPGDNLNIANSVCPAGSMFWVHGGTYLEQRVVDSKDGNFWLGVNGTVILDGRYATSSAFYRGMANNFFSWIEIRNYTERGIFSQSNSSTDIEINNMTFKNIGGNKKGEDDFGAIHFDNTENILINNSFFNNVSHSVRFRFSDGPLQVLNNEALNTGFGFFQCNGCEGKGYDIKINHNSIEHTTKYGKDDLFDFISIYKSKGTANNYIEVSDNRFRVNLSGNIASGVSQYGCAILLGDEGGKYQKAVNNIGVNPGACGIGVAAGEHIYVSDNKMYSQAVQPGISNVGYYSANYSPGLSEPCRYHHYESNEDLRNSADWTCVNPEGNCDPQNPIKNLAHASPNLYPCTDENDHIFNSTLNGLIKDEWGSMGAGIWNSW